MRILRTDFRQQSKNVLHLTVDPSTLASLGQQTVRASARAEQEVTTMEITTTSTAFACALPVVDHGTAPTWTYGQGTGVSVAMRNRTVAPIAKATALLPISDVVVFDGVAGIRSWSPPV
jgi:hypothetical protein